MQWLLFCEMPLLSLLLRTLSPNLQLVIIMDVWTTNTEALLEQDGRPILYIFDNQVRQNVNTLKHNDRLLLYTGQLLVCMTTFRTYDRS